MARLWLAQELVNAGVVHTHDAPPDIVRRHYEALQMLTAKYEKGKMKKRS